MANPWITQGRSDGLAVRAVGTSPELLNQEFDPILTALAQGRGQRTTMLSKMILPQTPVSKASFQWRQYKNEHLMSLDTRRAMEAPYNTRSWTHSVQSANVTYYGLATPRDVRVQANADEDLNMRLRDLTLARQGVELNQEIVAADLLKTAGSYPAGNVTTLAGGSEFNDPTNGDSRVAIRALATTIAEQFNQGADSINVAITQATANAAMDDPVFIARSYNLSIESPNETADTLRRYWGVKSVVIGDALSSVDADTAPTSVYGDIAILWLDEGMPMHDTSYGATSFGRHFTLNSGVASTPYYQESNTTWYYPWDAADVPLLINNTAGGLLLNCAA